LDNTARPAEKQDLNRHQAVSVLGAGSWGSTLAWLLAGAGKSVKLWSHDQQKAEAMRRQRHSQGALKVAFNEQIEVTSDLSEAIGDVEVVLLCCTSQAMRAVCERLSNHFGSGKIDKAPILVSAAKGLELHSLKRMSEVIDEILPNLSVCALSGPNLAAEMLAGLPTAAVIASKELSTAVYVQKVLSVPKLRIYSNTDLAGVELGGTLKNVIAIAAGGSDGLNLGANAKAALLTRGLAEMTRIAVYMGAKPSTLAGLAGMGDLFASCAGPLSRNYRLGMEMARGKSLAQIRQEIGAVIEGITTCEAVCELSKRVGVQLPIAELVQDTLLGTITPEKAIMQLMARPLASE
jgi:glycerol-3-phosphate dehydrogenase (NAD(P)+)